MRGRHLDLLTGSAVALVLMLTGPAAAAPDETSAAIEALVPLPESANMPPPTIADIGGPATANLTPKPADVAPASASPAAAPAPATAAPAAAPASPTAAPTDVAAAPAAPLDPVA